MRRAAGGLEGIMGFIAKNTDIKQFQIYYRLRHIFPMHLRSLALEGFHAAHIYF